jgi:hypothetical protein
MSDRDAVVPEERVESFIVPIRGRRVILDSDLARLYGVTTARLNEQVRRNPDRFPPDFMFCLSRQEFTALISQSATSKGRGGGRKLPKAFTEHGAIMAANVLNSGQAIAASVYVARAFVWLREMVAANTEIAAKLAELEQKVAGHDEAIHSLVQAIRQLMGSPPPVSCRRPIAFGVEEPRARYRLRRPGHDHDSNRTSAHRHGPERPEVGGVPGARRGFGPPEVREASDDSPPTPSEDEARWGQLDVFGNVPHGDGRL